MNSICIVTDSTAQFISNSFVGKNHTRIVPFTVELGGEPLPEDSDFSPFDLPLTATRELTPRLLPPSRETLRQLFTQLGAEYNEIIGVFSSSELTGCFSNAQDALLSLHGTPNILLIDSGSISFGLGYLVQTAAEAVVRGCNCIEVERKLRDIILRTYAVFCMPGLSYLHYSGFLDHAQALVGEMLGMYSLFAIEEGYLIPVEKVRSRRNIILYFQEYLDEFEKLDSLALIQNPAAAGQDVRTLREHIRDHFPLTIYSEHLINLPVALMFGPHSMGLFAIEKECSL